MDKGIFEVNYIPGNYGNRKVLITVSGAAAAALREIRGWSASFKDPECVNAVLETMPDMEWIRETSSAVRGCAASLTDSKGARELLDSWKEAARSAAGLPRVIIFREDEDLAGPRRKKRYLYAACDYRDIKMREVLKTLGFKWNRERRAYDIYEMPKDIELMEMVLNEWNRPYRPVSIRGEDMFRHFPGLKREQQESIEFLLARWREGWHGALDADDMGIGKTLTALVTGRMAIEAGHARKIIVVANLQTVGGWIKEWTDMLKSKAPAFNFTSQTMSKARYKDDDTVRQEMSEAELIVTNYEHLKNERNMSLLLPFCRDSVTVFDEATKCANNKTGNFRASAMVSLASSFAVGLTGTPLSKNIYEAWSIFRLLDPGIYPSEEFYSVHMKEKEYKLWIPKYKKTKTLLIPEYFYPDIFQERVRDHFIRHEKNIAAMDAEKVERRFEIDRCDSVLENEAAWKIFNRVSEVFRKDIDFTHFGDEEGVSVPRWQLSAMGYIQAALDDPYIMFGSKPYMRYREDLKELTSKGIPEERAKEHVFARVQKDAYGGNTNIPVYGGEQKAVFEYLDSCNREAFRNYIPAKAVMLSRLLKEEWNGKRVIIFCSYSRTCDRTVELLKILFPDRSVSQIKGSMNMKTREASVETFRDSEGGILVCTDAMAFGTNLQFADALVHYNIPWSSAVWKQRTDRIFRTGSEGRKDIVYLTIDHPLEQRKVNLMEKNLKTMKDALDIDMMAMPEELHTIFDFEKDIPCTRPDSKIEIESEEECDICI